MEDLQSLRSTQRGTQLTHCSTVLVGDEKDPRDELTFLRWPFAGLCSVLLVDILHDLIQTWKLYLNKFFEK